MEARAKTIRAKHAEQNPANWRMSAYGYKRRYRPALEHDLFPAITGHFGLRGPLAATKPTFCRTVADDRS